MMTSNTPYISLIVPVYNVEDYLTKALKSIENQTLNNIEVIIVNDGSQDNSAKIIDNFAKTNSNFKVITQKNQGLSIARNVGIKASTGEYIAFLDSDDYLEPKFLETLYNMAKKRNSDIVCCNFNFYFPNKDVKIYMPFTSIPGTYNKHSALKKLILDLGTHHYAWNKIYKRSLFVNNDIKYHDMYFEDIATSPKLFYYAEKVTFIGKALYNYTFRNNSILNTMTAKKINDYISAIGVIRNFLEKNADYNKYKNYIWVYSQKAKIVTYYYIMQVHMRNNNYDGIKKNLTAANKAIDYIVSEKFNICDNDVPLIPYLVIEPSKKVK